MMKDKHQTEPGERMFTILILLGGIYFTYASLKMYQMAPGASSYAAVPLFVSILVVLFSGLTLIFDLKREKALRNSLSKDALKTALTYILPKDIAVMVVLIVLYAFALSIRIHFYAVTPIFLWVSMSYLMHGHYFKNLLWTALSLGFIFVMFSIIFNVVLP